MSEVEESVQSKDQGAIDPIAAKIIARQTGVEVPVEPEKEQQDSTDKVDESQVETQGEAEQTDAPEIIPITQEDFDLLTKDLGYTEEDLNEFEKEDINAIIQTKTKKPVVEEKEGTPAKQPDIVVTPEIAEKYGGIAKSFIGKDIGELFEAMKNNNSYITKLSSELSGLKKQLTSAEKTKVEELEKELKTTTLSDEEFWKKNEELTNLKVEAKLRASQPDPTEATKQAEFYQHVQSALPEGLKAEVVAEEWWKSLDQQSQDVYAKSNPIIVASAIQSYAMIKTKDAVVKEKEAVIEDKDKDVAKKARILAAEIARKALQESKGKEIKGSKFRITARQTKPATYGDPVADAIMKRKLEG